MKRLSVVLAMAAMLVVLAAVPALAQTSTLFVSDVSPNGGSANVAANSNISATFDVRIDRTTINTTTFYLKQKGSTAVVPAQVTYNRTTKTATLNPDANLTFGATYTAFVKGGRTGVKGAGGQTLGGTTDATATFANAKVSWTFTVATPPNTTIDSGPSGTVADRSASFSFSSSKENSSFECSLDGTPFASCTSPKSVPEVGLLTDGSHTFRVRAIDTLGNVDSTPARRTWTVDTIAPDTTIDTKPANPSNNASPSFTFSGTDNVTPSANLTFECKLDTEASFTSCTSPKALSNLAEGSHTFSVRAKDAAGNVDAMPDSYTWTLNTVPIEATPSKVNFGAACPGVVPSPVTNVTLKNITTEPITVVPSISGTNASNFSVPTDQITLASGDTAVLPVTYTPSGAMFSTKTASLELKDAGGNIVLTIPLEGAVRCPIVG